MKYFINLILLGLIVLFEDKRNENQIFVHIKKVHLPDNYLQIKVFLGNEILPGQTNKLKSNSTELYFNVNNKIIKCNFIKKYKNNLIKTKKIGFLNCNNKGFIFTFSSCDKNYSTLSLCSTKVSKCSNIDYKIYKKSFVCRYKITPSIAYKCFPSNKCDLNLFNSISGLIYM